jgi:hypothetical protein
MAAYTGSIVGTNALGRPGELSVVTGKFTFSAATLATTDTFTAELFTQNGVEVPVEILGFEIFSTVATPASLIASVGNSDDADGFMIATGFTQTLQMVRHGNGALIGTRIKNKTVSMTVTVDAGAAYTGDLVLKFLVKRTND